MTEVLTPPQLEDALKQLPGWSIDDNKLTRTWRFADFKQAFAFLTRVADAAEQQGHHPEIYNVYATVRIQLSTHDADDRITDKDTALATAIQKLS
ncbi:Putative pterin-4-alpha-carbinolamine dehydratase [Mucisphaera calidilacus]|uniref:Putative pterin-4-alpha-carbinolamine dehydratase n=2 Tax=Mucisphaera calidilacus TaxID=2527982 RepID=A0A518C055_9BACT|nr:4a-hydroxytetrahydrobiopterin dehydratase [Mucisphaera calidilacus]QDU72604.1 Putative pterin-4-alpha-carbinolamine dehydratase [Mucisphaera calidilacus]